MQLSEHNQATALSNLGNGGEPPSLVVVVDHHHHQHHTKDDSFNNNNNNIINSQTSLPIASGSNHSVKDYHHHHQQQQQLHHHRSPHSKKEAMKSINDAASTYLSSNGTQAASTSKIVDQALHVVKSREAASNSNMNMNHNMNNNSLSSNSTAASSAATTVASSSVTSADSSSSSSHDEGLTGGDTAATQAEPNFIAPALRKIAKKRRKEPDKNGMERSSFHHTKSSKEYLRKAQEAWKRQQELGQESSTTMNEDQVSHEPLVAAPPVSSKFHSPRSNFRRLSMLSSSEQVDPVPFSRSQSLNSVGLSKKNGSDSTCTKNSNFYGYEDPDTAAASSNSNPYGYGEDPDPFAPNNNDSNPYGYEDPDNNIIPAPRRTGPARRRGSVTKYSLQAAQAAQKATERVMKLQGLNWKRNLSNNNCVSSSENETRSTTPTGRRRPLSSSVGMETTEPIAPQDKQALPVEKPIRRGSIAVEDVDNIPSKNSTDAMDTSNPYGYEQVQPATGSENLYGYEDPDAASTKIEATSSNPYGYETCNPMPVPSERRHPRARRRGSVTKFSLEAAQTVVASETDKTAQPPPPPPQNEYAGKPADNPDYILALKPPAAGRPLGVAARNRRCGNPSEQTGIAEDDPKACSPRRNGPIRSTSSSRHFSRFGTPSRSSSFLSSTSATSFEDDADSLAPDMESLCSIHDRFDGGLDSAPIPPAPPLMSPITPAGLTPAGGGPLRKTLLGPGKSWSERNNNHTPSYLVDSDFAILPFALSGSDSRSSSRMPAPPVRRTPSSSSATSRSNGIPISIQTARPVATNKQPAGDLRRSSSFSSQ